MLPFVAACLGPTTRGHFMTRPSVLNLFWLNVAASGVGKSETRKRLVSEPMNTDVNRIQVIKFIYYETAKKVYL